MRVLFLCLLVAVCVTGCGAEEEALRKAKPSPVEIKPSTYSSRSPTARVPVSTTEEKAGSDAKQVLNAAIAEAKASNKQLFVHFGAQW